MSRSQLRGATRKNPAEGFGPKTRVTLCDVPEKIRKKVDKLPAPRARPVKDVHWLALTESELRVVLASRRFPTGSVWLSVYSKAKKLRKSLELGKGEGSDREQLKRLERWLELVGAADGHEADPVHKLEERPSEPVKVDGRDVVPFPEIARRHIAEVVLVDDMPLQLMPRGVNDMSDLPPASPLDIGPDGWSIRSHGSNGKPQGRPPGKDALTVLAKIDPPPVYAIEDYRLVAGAKGPAVNGHGSIRADLDRIFYEADQIGGSIALLADFFGLKSRPSARKRIERHRQRLETEAA
jgi:hypothetical protein